MGRTLHEVFRIREVRDHRIGGTVVALNPPDTGSNRDPEIDVLRLVQPIPGGRDRSSAVGLPREGINDALNFFSVTHGTWNNPYSGRPSECFESMGISCPLGGVLRIEQKQDASNAWADVFKDFEPFAAHGVLVGREPGDIAGGSRAARDKPR